MIKYETEFEYTIYCKFEKYFKYNNIPKIYKIIYISEYIMNILISNKIRVLPYNSIGNEFRRLYFRSGKTYYGLTTISTEKGRKSNFSLRKCPHGISKKATGKIKITFIKGDCDDSEWAKIKMLLK